MMERVNQPSSFASNRRVIFPSKLFLLLRDVELSGQTHIVSWLPDGVSFKVHNRDEFVANILPRYFRQTTYRSFQRQLYIYGFSRINDGTSNKKGAYWNPLFLRGDEIQASSIRRRGSSLTLVQCEAITPDVRKSKDGDADDIIKCPANHHHDSITLPSNQAALHHEQSLPHSSLLTHDDSGNQGSLPHIPFTRILPSLSQSTTEQQTSTQTNHLPSSISAALSSKLSHHPLQQPQRQQRTLPLLFHGSAQPTAQIIAEYLRNELPVDQEQNSDREYQDYSRIKRLDDLPNLGRFSSTLSAGIGHAEALLHLANTTNKEPHERNEMSLPPPSSGCISSSFLSSPSSLLYAAAPREGSEAAPPPPSPTNPSFHQRDHMNQDSIVTNTMANNHMMMMIHTAGQNHLAGGTDRVSHDDRLLVVREDSRSIPTDPEKDSKTEPAIARQTDWFSTLEDHF